MTRDAERELDIYEARLSMASVGISPTPASYSGQSDGAIMARGFESSEHEIEIVLLVFEDASKHPDVIRSIKASTWAKASLFDFAGSGPALLIVRSPRSDQDTQAAIDSLLSAFSGSE